MTVLGTAAAVVTWLVVGGLAYLTVAAIVLFFLPSADRFPSGPVADAAFVLTLPLVLATTWLATLRHRG